MKNKYFLIVILNLIFFSLLYSYHNFIKEEHYDDLNEKFDYKEKFSEEDFTDEINEIDITKKDTTEENYKKRIVLDLKNPFVYYNEKTNEFSHENPFVDIIDENNNSLEKNKQNKSNIKLNYIVRDYLDRIKPIANVSFNNRDINVYQNDELDGWKVEVILNNKVLLRNNNTIKKLTMEGVKFE